VEVVEEIPMLKQAVDICRDRFQAYVQNGGEVVAETIENKYGLLAPWTAIILISGTEYRLTFKVHFPLKQVGSMAGVASSDAGGSAEEKLKAKSFDFLKEFCNFYGGSLKRAFADSEITMGISLPMLTRGFDEVFFPRADHRNSFETFWEMKNDLGLVRCSLHIEAANPEKLKGLSITLDSSDEGEIEFL
jgi:hypothetical protein